ncbi:MAG: tripartite tricarboxylate transporter substrate binding protein [Rhizobiales bacterium]|nr:tripartite tricarboxylate transporter substrate binding protein [Hyphomicrobiales bacterium]
MSETWQPRRAVQIVAGTPPGGGLDRVARALAQAIGQAGALGVPVEVVNVAGDGARRAWTHFVDQHPGNAHVLSISSPNLTTDYLAGIADFEHSKYTAIATLVTEYIVFAVAANSDIKIGADLIARLGAAPRQVTVALSTALGNPNHVALAKLTRVAGGNIGAPAIRVFDSALDAVADVVAGKADVCAVTAASVLKELEASRVRVLAISAPARLTGSFAEVPTWKELGVDCAIGAWRGVSAPAAVPPAQVEFWQGIIADATGQPVWREALARLNWSPMLRVGADLREYLAQERAEFVAVLGALGLLKRH